ncbi:MAG: MarR family winged helix-turn-helix transcriptional regulator [Acetobacteraceae bacterium]
MSSPLPDAADYALLAQFRTSLRRFLGFSAEAARKAGLAPQQHQALLVIKGAPGERLAIGALAEALALRPHSAVGLIDRLAAAGLVRRLSVAEDRRRVDVALTERAEALLAALSAAHLEELRRLRPALAALLARLEEADDGGAQRL